MCGVVHKVCYTNEGSGETDGGAWGEGRRGMRRAAQRATGLTTGRATGCATGPASDFNPQSNYKPELCYR